MIEYHYSIIVMKFINIHEIYLHRSLFVSMQHW